MTRKGKFSRKIYVPANRRGATAIIVAIVLVVLLGVAALAVDIGYLYAAKNELQNAADSAALAGARQLGNIYSLLTVTQQMAYTAEADDQSLIRNTAVDIASQNKAATQSILINAAEVEIGQWASGAFTATTNQPDAVRVTARRDAGTGGTIGTFFARVLGINEASVVADATAALSPQSTTEPGNSSCRSVFPNSGSPAITAINPSSSTPPAPSTAAPVGILSTKAPRTPVHWAIPSFRG